MNSRLRLGLVGAALLLGLASCEADQYGTFYISKALHVGTTCGTPAPVAGSGVTVGSGVLDISYKLGYQLFPQIENQLASTVASGVERNILQLREIRITLDLSSIPGDHPAEHTYVEKLTGTIPPGGQLVAPVTIIPDDLVPLLPTIPKNVKPVVTATLRAVAVKTGDEIESAPYPFNVKLCSGCLMDLRATCPNLETDKGSYYTQPCGRAQDQPVTCCTEKGEVVCLRPKS